MKTKYAIINIYANNGVFSYHRTLKGMVRGLKKIRRQFYKRPEYKNSIPPWDYGVRSENFLNYERIEKDSPLKAEIWELEQERWVTDDYES